MATIFTKIALEHINRIDRIINKMSNHSKFYKIATLFLLLIGSNIMIFLLPIILFYYVDSYYLGLEQYFIGKSNNFIKDLKKGDLTEQDMLSINMKDIPNTLDLTLNGMNNFSTFGFYTPIIVTVFFICFYG